MNRTSKRPQVFVSFVLLLLLFVVDNELFSGAFVNAKECPRPTLNWGGSARRGRKAKIRFQNQANIPLMYQWIDFNGNEHPGTTLIEMDVTVPVITATGHRFRIYADIQSSTTTTATTEDRILLMEYEVPETAADEDSVPSSAPSGSLLSYMNPSKTKNPVVPIYGCDETEKYINRNVHLAEDVVLNYHKEMINYVHDQKRPCLPENDSSKWSCIQYIPKQEYENRKRTNPGGIYGFNSTQEAQFRQVGETEDDGYVRHIPNIIRVTNGNGYLKMNFTDTLKGLLIPWYEEHKKGGPNDAVEDHNVIPGGYTNSHTVTMTRINLDNFPQIIHDVAKEMKRILQWWTGLQLIHTSTFGLRIYHNGSMLINHVDRADTHIASAVLQVDQGGVDIGWPLEVLDEDGNCAEVYLQPGEMVLYEGARFKHGRPMRFQGEYFANIFTHFRPIDWHGPKKSPNYDGKLDSKGYSSTFEIKGGEDYMRSVDSDTQQVVADEL